MYMNLGEGYPYQGWLQFYENPGITKLPWFYDEAHPDSTLGDLKVLINYITGDTLSFPKSLNPSFHLRCMNDIPLQITLYSIT
jgi:hypothetical protein